MNKGKLLALLVVLILVAGGGWYVYTSLSNPTTDLNTNQQEAEQMTEESVDRTSMEKTTGTFKELLSSANDKKCTLNYLDEQTNTNGTIYIAQDEQKIAGHFETTPGTDQPAVVVDFIQDGNKAYYWTSGNEQGYMLTLDDQNTIFDESVSEEYDINTVMDMEQTIDYECSDWNVDESRFVPPENIDFVSFGDLMENVNCSVCENLEGQARTQCLQSLNCQ